MKYDIFNESKFHMINRDNYSIVYSKDKNVFFRLTKQEMELLNNNSTSDLLEVEKVESNINNLLDDELDVIELNPELFLKTKRIKILEIMIQTDCNMHCKYCYADGGNYGYGRKVLTISNALKYIQGLIDLGITEIEMVRFFGGEPTEYSGTIVKICEYFDKLVLKNKINNIPKFMIISNGTIYNSILSETFIKFNFMVTFSIDGPKEINDRLRVFNNNTGTFDIVANNIKHFMSDGLKNISIEVTYTTEHINNNYSTDQIVQFIQNELNVNNVILTHCRGETSYALEKQSSVNLYCNDFKSNLLRLSNVNFKNDYIEQNFLSIFNNLLLKQFVSGHCPVVFENICIFPDGKIYPCHIFSLEEDNYCFGEFIDGKWDFTKINKIINKLSTYKNENCKNCWCEYICSVCPQRKIHGNECYSIKTMYETIMITLCDISENKDDWNRLIINYNNLISHTLKGGE